jgi:hypothetical protein
MLANHLDNHDSELLKAILAPKMTVIRFSQSSSIPAAYASLEIIWTELLLTA